MYGIWRVRSPNVVTRFRSSPPLDPTGIWTVTPLRFAD